MLRIPCPHCGLRDHAEFTYGGDAIRTRPPGGGATDSDWTDHIYNRGNPKGPHDELWHHTLGCRSWILVRRDTATHQILDVRLPHRRSGEAP